MTLAGFVADEGLRDILPFPRMREKELLQRNLQELRLWPWVALSDNPTNHATHQPPMDASLPPSALVADSAKPSTRAHLFHFYPCSRRASAKLRQAWTYQEALDASPRPTGR
ncbi:hypothetical protein FA95DRAFT_1613246 [Auriscalpium vulgare]|uniref:Uncharacterized protein n=1 Tax=Auriscalpium vulgare TaxID=40419 RepID=A0ACB8R3H4_9AGAM|nr:hypothetical protein FA95DRAFT_1613246 [Auriscalpium vulgare]